MPDGGRRQLAATGEVSHYSVLFLGELPEFACPFSSISMTSNLGVQSSSRFYDLCSLQIAPNCFSSLV